MIANQRKTAGRATSWCVHPLAALSLSTILLIGSCAPVPRPVAASGSISPIAQVGRSITPPGLAYLGRSPEGDQARIYLANGVQVIAPPGKDLLALQGDANNCLYGGGSANVDAYLACLHNAGDNLRLPNGNILAWGEDHPNIPSPITTTPTNTEQDQVSTAAPRAPMDSPGVSGRYPTQQENTDVGSGILGGSFFSNEEHYQKEQQMEEINQERSEPLDRNDSQYEEMNNPSGPQD